MFTYNIYGKSAFFSAYLACFWCIYKSVLFTYNGIEIYTYIHINQSIYAE